MLSVTASIAALGQEPEGGVKVYGVPDLNGRAVVLVKPDLPSSVDIPVDGLIMLLRVIVDANGDVVSAQCSSKCPNDARLPAEAAARASKFRPLVVAGQAVGFGGTLSYSITGQKVNWYRFATVLQSAFAFRNLSLGPAAALLTNEFADERTRLQQIDTNAEVPRRATMEAVKHSIDAKLKGTDRWWFDLGLCVRAVTVPFQASGKLDIDGLQDDIDYLARFTKSPPTDVPPAALAALRELASYKIDPNMPPKEVGDAIFKIESGIHP